MKAERGLTQLAFLAGEAFVFLSSGAAIYILISRLAGVELLGQYSLILAWTTCFQAAGNFGLPEFLLREVGKSSETGALYARHGLILGSLASVAATAGMAGIVLATGYPPEISRALLLASVTMLPVMVAMVCRSSFVATRRGHWVLFIAFIEASILLGASTLLLLKGGGILQLVEVFIVAKSVSAAVSLGLALWLSAVPVGKLQLKTLREMVSPLSTFTTSNAMGLVSSRVNVILLSMMSNLVSVGLYSAVSKIHEALQLIPSIIGQIILPRISRTFASSKSYRVDGYHAYFSGLFALVMPLALGISIFARPLIELIYGRDFSGSAIILRILMLYLVLDCGEMIMGIILKASGHQKEDVRFYSANLVANVLLNVLLIPGFAGVGSAAAKIGGVLCSFSLRAWFIGSHLAHVGWRVFTAKSLLASAFFAACTVPFLGRVHTGILVGAYVLASAVFLIRVGAQVLQLGSKSTP